MFGRSAGPEVIQRRSTWQLMRQAEAEGVVLLADSGQGAQGGAVVPATLVGMAAGARTPAVRDPDPT
jgi:hypothetical protein